MTLKQRPQVIAPALYTIGSGLSTYTGAALALSLFALFEPSFVAWLRVLCAGLILILISGFKPQLLRGPQAKYIIAYGISMVSMNVCFYNAIDSIPLGTAVAIEFLGPIVVGAIASRTPKHLIALACSAGGVLCISGAQWTQNASGILFALGAATGWAVYIAIGLRLAQHMNGTQQQTRQILGLALCIGALAATPIAYLVRPDSFGTAPMSVVGLALTLALLATVVPSICDFNAMRLASPQLYAILTALMPLVATLCGAVMLGQVLSGIEVAGTLLIVGAVLLRREA
ncbi:DMT family transporter [Corynebacterium sp. HS2168-gen11]|uniref:EamA family transporter n=1 Tax=Corynebacterium sp. HS2168-gen11 TaxID=2974027 RepID=UPI00216ADE9F|nr:EamA family transporter [Corynebacterium sp. HS2168-gen11]MCS4536207.1 EamA family transporter [Corynebacterium sp. HS2168-gen11]